MFTPQLSLPAAVLSLLLVGCVASCVGASPATDRVRESLENLDSWLGDNANAQKWHQYLLIPQLEAQLAVGEQADSAVLSKVLQQFESGANGLELHRFVAVRTAIQDWRDSLTSNVDLSVLAREASDDLTPITDADVAAAKDRVAEQASELEAYLQPGGANGEAWKKYLGWDLLQSQLVEGATPDRAQLARVVDRLTANEAGLELPPFQNLARALEDYQAILLMHAASDQRKTYADFLNQLSEILARHAEAPTARSSYMIGQRIGSVAALGQSPDFVAAVRRQHAKPNFYMEATSDFLNRAASRDVHDVGPVRDCILGTSISGTGTTTGKLTLTTLPANDRARFLLSVTANTQACTTGLNGPAIMRSSSTTDFTSRKIVEITDPAFLVYPADVDATTNSHTYSVQKRGGGIGSRLVSAVASRQVAQKKSQADAIASRHAEERVANEMNEEVLGQIQKARDRYSEEFRQPLQRRNAYPNLIQFSSTDAGINVKVLHATKSQLAASGAPPEALSGFDIAARIHQSAIENAVAVSIGGATISQASADADPKINRKIPDWLQEILDERSANENSVTDENFTPWSIEFRRIRPVSVTFGDNKITVTIHAAKLLLNGKTYDGWDLELSFTPHEQNGMISLIREGEIVVIPTSFDPTSGKNISASDIPLRSVLTKDLNERADRGEIPEVMELEPIEMPEDLKHLGMMWVRHLKPAGGWLTVGLNAEND